MTARLPLLHTVSLGGSRFLAPVRPARPVPDTSAANLTVRVAETANDRLAAAALVARRYAWRGYPYPSKPTQDLANQLTLVVWSEDDAVATLTLRRDSAEGLLSETLYQNEVDTLRQAGSVLCEVTRLATDCDDDNRLVLATLFRAAHHYGRTRFGATDAVIEVNPRHARFYQREFRFQRIGNVRHCPRVDAPAVLLHRPVDALTLPVPSVERPGPQPSSERRRISSAAC